MTLRLHRHWEIVLIFLVLPLQVVSGDLFVLVSGKVTPYPLLNLAIQFLALLRQRVVPFALPILVAAAVSCI